MLDDVAKDLTTGQAAEEIGVSVGTLRKWVREGVIRPTAQTPHGHLRWDLDDLRRQVAPKKRESTEEWGPAPIVAAIVTSQRGVLVVKRRDGRPPWTFVSGEVEPEENPADAAVRETKEEACLEVSAGRYIGTRVHPATGRLMLYMAAHPTEGTDVFVGDDRELSEVRWVTLSEADKLMPTMFGPVRDWLSQNLAALSGPARTIP